MTLFKPGARIWYVERDESGEAVDISGVMFMASVNRYVVASSIILGCVGLEQTLEFHADETAELGESDLMVIPVEDCYAQRDEAKNALEEEREG